MKPVLFPDCRYPEKARQSLQLAHCYIPANLAAVLEHSPQLIAPVVQTFCTRDPLDLKVSVLRASVRAYGGGGNQSSRTCVLIELVVCT